MALEANLPQVVNLNVGGRTFTTSLATLRSHPESMLAKMCSGSHPMSQVDGAYFIDRTGDAFEVVLDYLRGGLAVSLPDDQFMLRNLKKA